jgi:uncharacterized membrane protein
LCLEAEENLNSLQDKYPHRLVLVDIEKQDLRMYEAEIPVIEVGPYSLKAPFDKKTVEVTLASAADRQTQLDEIDVPGHKERVKRGSQLSAVDSFFYWLSKRYMLVFNFAVFLYVGLAFLAPVFQMNGYQRPANFIYGVYSRLCHQLAFRSWFIEGDQIAYPREAAGLDSYINYQEATGLDPFDLNRAQQFKGNPELGYKVALCQRDVAIYLAILLFGILFSLSGKRIRSLPIAAWIILGMVPIGLDGVSQIVSQLPWNIIPLRESTPFLRSLTGALFGFTTAWFGYPLVEESMADTRKILTVKHAVVKGKNQE